MKLNVKFKHGGHVSENLALQALQEASCKSVWVSFVLKATYSLIQFLTYTCNAFIWNYVYGSMDF